VTWTDFTAGRFVPRLGKKGLRLIYRSGLVPVDWVLRLRNLVPGEDALFPDYGELKGPGRDLHNQFLAGRLADTELGTWSLTASALNFLERQVQILQPRVMLEFGSGISTVCLARYMQELHGDSNRVYLFSIEQEVRFVQSTKELLKSLQLEKYVQIVVCPLRRQLIKSVEASCYDLSFNFLKGALKDNRPDFVVIDGPAAEPGARFGALPLIQPFLNGESWFFLDDALRDGELKVAQLWKRLPGVQINGICLEGKGLLVGQVKQKN
jgi:hypothetical protein